MGAGLLCLLARSADLLDRAAHEIKIAHQVNNRETGLRIEAEAMLAASKAEIARLEMELDWYRAFYLSHVSEPHGVA